MRILRVRFKNLNSLAGEWDIDLSHPAFVADGLFAITGPTGAGKTTILDAICLALYASTPRLNKVSKGTNEILSRRTGECFAEVTFETQSGRYRCHWSQHRSRRKPDGELQNPKHEIVEADSGRIIDASVRGVAERIESVTGMDFERFTRSMLLAQGAFDTFLRAAPDARAPILEQITGTEIYSRISIGVHERRRVERETLDRLSAELAGMPLLSEEEERQSRAQLAEHQSTDAALGGQLDQTRQAIAWLDGLAGLERDLTAIAARWLDLGARQDAFAPEQARLERANRALELAGEFAGLAARRAELTKERQALADSMTAQPEREQALNETEAAWRAAAEALKQRTDEQERMRPIVQRVRELDARLAEKAGPIQTLADTLAERDKSLAALRAKQTEELGQLDTDRAALAALGARLEARRSDAALVERLAGIQGRFETLKEIQAQRASQTEEQRTAEARIAATSHAWTERIAKGDRLKGERDSLQVQLDQRRSDLDALLRQREIPEWREIQTTSQVRKTGLEQLGESADALLNARRTRDELSARQAALALDGTRLADQIQTETERANRLDREQGLLETQLRLVRRIQSFEEARAQLADGEPCPLCGAIEHPFAEGNSPLPDDSRDELDRVRAESNRVRETINDLRIRQVEATKDLERILAGQAECVERIAAQTDRIAEARVALALPDSDPETLLAGLPQWRRQAQADLDQASDVLTRADRLTEEIAKTREALEAARISVAAAELELQTAVHEKEAAEQGLARLATAIEELDTRCQTALEAARLEVAPHGIAALAPETLDSILLDLTARRDQWRSWQTEQDERAPRAALLENQTRERAERIEQLDRERIEQGEQLAGLRRERETLAQERQTLLADRPPDAVETLLSAAIETARQGRDDASQKRLEASQDLERLKTRLAELTRSIETRASEGRIAETAFAERRLAAGFADEPDYLGACLTEEARDRLRQEAKRLDDERAELTARERDLHGQLASERQRGLTDQPRDALNQTVAEQETEQKTLRETIGGLRQRLDDNEAIKLRQLEGLAAIAAQRRECERWDKLHGLIGSSDGKKYRNFAQGLTFDIMIGHANRQLQRMSDRYLLIRDETQPLDLNVIDKDQAGEIRSAKNLSGGESFIVSLALALGLSRMASQKVRVDSLFLDEGFGTLDEDALETALETLAGLRRDGKLIGVISHVPALKERIGTQIQVTPMRGGRSRIQGPGCLGKA
ncbi:AAA family ATPase [Thiocystis violacea]|uniref:AAA family ATPase n=1 Tax=Thiocystis violacea TaxID=13725 RepID=UPI0019036419|nr:AAA family ATPase [Thiocystis violacea]